MPEAGGALGLGTFRWDCIASGDAVCDRGVFPSAAAVGGRFDLDFDAVSPLPDEISPGAIEPVSSIITAESGGLVAQREGEVTLVVMSGHGAVDFIDLSVREVSDLSLSLRREPEPRPEDEEEDYCPSTPGPESVDAAVEVVVGESPTLRATPYGDGLALGGGLEYAWESLTPAVVSVVDLGGREARFEALAEGTARLAVRVQGHEQFIDVEVGPAPVPESEGEGPRRTRPDDEGPRRTRPGDDDGTGTGGMEDSGSDDSGEDSGSGESGSGESGSGESGSGTSGGME